MKPLAFVNDRFLWLPIGAALAVAWVNLAPESYFTVAHRLAFPVNEIGMALFVGLLMQEAIELVMPGGALHTWRRWTMAVVAAAGGMLGAAFGYLGWVSIRHEMVLANAWPVAAAIDIAAGYYVLRLIFHRGHAATSLLLAIGIVTNAAGLIALAVWPAFTPEHLDGALLVGAAVTLAVVLRAARVQSVAAYLVLCGPVSWIGFQLAGVHPALALVPVIPFVPRRARPQAMFVTPNDNDDVHQGERNWSAAVHLVLFLFGLVNAGVVLRGYDTGSWGVLIAALVGRPAGILIAAALAVAAGLHLPPRIGWRELGVVAMATSSGFTVALFTATSLLPAGAVLTQVKVGALLTAVGALVTLGLARALHVGHGLPRPAVRVRRRRREATAGGERLSTHAH